jgi:hypothetical protein
MIRWPVTAKLAAMLTPMIFERVPQAFDYFLLCFEAAF